ncbi:MAG: hypothetical protein M0027_06885 [Candidatus Dormibacteraeota bacterium]|jgi:hypothetical protein|nr:hypothetical protein [Candidatus Dormibacteraeota bacterium]
MTNTKAARIPALPHLVSVGLIMPSVMGGTAILLDRVAFGASLWMWGWIVGWPVGVAAGLGALRLWVGEWRTVWSEPDS